MPTASSLTITRHAAAALLLALLAACGGGSGAGSTAFMPLPPAAEPVVPVAPTHRIGGTVRGLLGSGLVVRGADGETLAISADGPFSFPKPLREGLPYAVSVQTQPQAPSQTCTVNRANGQVGNADVTDVAVVCATESFAVGGTVRGLAGTGLVLQNNAGDDLPVAVDGSFRLPALVASGAGYAVTVKSQPTGPAQTCSIGLGTGTVRDVAVNHVAVVCAIDSFAVGGTISGLVGAGLILQNNGQDNLAVAAGDGTFRFTQAVASGATYAVTVLARPGGPAQTCSAINASGTVGASPVNNVAILCTVDSHPVGGRISGLLGRGLVLQNNAGDDLSIDFAANGDFTFAAPVASGASYTITVKAQPQFVHQTCTVTGGTGQIVSDPVRTVDVRCVLAAPSAQPARFAYVSGQGDNSLTAFSIDATGALAPLPGPPTVTGRAPMGVSLHPNDRFVYVANSGDATVSAYVVQANGLLAPAGTPTVATGSGPLFLGIDPRGRFAYAVNGGSRTVSAYRIDATTGELTLVATTATSTAPYDLVVDPTGRFVYVAHPSGSVSTHLIDPMTGLLTTSITTQAGDQPNAVTVHPSGRFVYVANMGNDSVSIYAADASSGTLTPASTVPTGSRPSYIAVDPTGRFAYVANVGGDVSAYVIDADTGGLTEVTPRVTAGAAPSSLAIDPTGQFVYVTNRDSHTVSAYALHATTGALTPNASAPTVTTGRFPQGIVLSRR